MLEYKLWTEPKATCRLHKFQPIDRQGSSPIGNTFRRTGFKECLANGRTQRTEIYKEAQAAPPPSPIGGIRVGCGSRACFVCKIWLAHSEVARGVRDSEDISPVVGKVTISQFLSYVTTNQLLL